MKVRGWSKVPGAKTFRNGWIYATYWTIFIIWTGVPMNWLFAFIGSFLIVNTHMTVTGYELQTATAQLLKGEA